MTVVLKTKQNKTKQTKKNRGPIYFHINRHSGHIPITFCFGGSHSRKTLWNKVMFRRIFNDYNSINLLNKKQIKEIGIYPKKGKFRDETIIDHRKYICSKVLQRAEAGYDRKIGFILRDGNTH